MTLTRNTGLRDDFRYGMCSFSHRMMAVGMMMDVMKLLLNPFMRNRMGKIMLNKFAMQWPDIGAVRNELPVRKD